MVYLHPFFFFTAFPFFCFYTFTARHLVEECCKGERGRCQAHLAAVVHTVGSYFCFLLQSNTGFTHQQYITTRISNMNYDVTI